MAGPGRTPVALLALSAAALLSSWTPASAPSGLVVGVAAALLCLAERRRAGGLTTGVRVALVTSIVAAVASLAVMLFATGLGLARHAAPIVVEPSGSDRGAQLERASEATRAGRGAARKELETLERGH
jgi:hypothetical protein